MTTIVSVMHPRPGRSRWGRPDRNKQGGHPLPLFFSPKLRQFKRFEASAWQPVLDDSRRANASVNIVVTPLWSMRQFCDATQRTGEVEQEKPGEQGAAGSSPTPIGGGQPKRPSGTWQSTEPISCPRRGADTATSPGRSAKDSYNCVRSKRHVLDAGSLLQTWRSCQNLIPSKLKWEGAQRLASLMSRVGRTCRKRG